MAIVEELELDITSALDAIESLNQPLTELGSNLTETLTTAIEAVDVTPLVDQLAALDASGLTTTIDAAIDATDGLVPIDADTASVPGEIDAAIASADTTITVEADTELIGGSIDEALNATNATVTIDGEASGITSEIDSAIEAADTTLTIETDTGDSEGELGGVTEGLEGIRGAAGLAGGDIAGMTDTITSLGKKAGPVGSGVVAGLGAIGGVVSTIATKALGAQGIMERFRDVVGEFRDNVSEINVGSLDTDIGKLATKLGSTESALTDAATNAFLFGKNAGLSGDAASEFSNQVLALSARAVALNPALGSVEDVAAKFQKSLLTGRGIVNFVGQLDDADVAARALAISGKTNVEELGKTDLAFARASLGAEKYGKGLDKDITKGSKNAIIQQRSVTASIEDFLEKAGQPLVAPFLDILKSLIPVVKAVAPIFVTLGEATLPVFAQVLKDMTPTIELFGEIMKELSPIIIPLVRASLLLLAPFTGISKAFASISESGLGLGDLFSGISDAIGDLLLNVVNFGGELIDNFLRGIQEAFPAVVSFFANLGTTIFNTIGDVLFTIVQKGTDLITGLFTGITNAAVAVFTFFTNLAGTVFDTIGDVVGTLVQKGSDFIGGLLSGIVDKATEVFDFFIGLPEAIFTTVGDVLGKLVQKGSDLIQGLIDGIVEKAKSIPGILKKKVTDVIPGFIKNALGIGSPSKVLAGIGADIGAGLIQGMDSSLSGIKSASASMVAAALPIPGVGALPAVAAALPVSAGSAAASTAGFTSSAQASLQGAGNGVNIQQLIVQTTAKDQTQVGIEVARQLRAESFRAGR